MSDAWKSWVDTIQQDSAKVKCADNSGIYGLDGNPWCQSNNLNLTPQEVKDAVAVLDKGAGGSSVVIGHEKYHVLRAEADHFVAKQNKKGLTVAKGKQCVIIGLYDDHSYVTPGNNCKQVCIVKDQLVEHGY